MTTVVPPRLSACAQLRGHRLSPCPRASRCAPAPIKSRRAESHAALRQHRPRHQHQQQLRARSRAAVVTRAEPAARSSDSAADSEAKAPAQGEANAEDNGEEEEAEEVDVDEEMSRIDRLLDLFVNELKSMDMLTSEVDRYLAKATVPAEFASVGQERIRTAFRDSMKKNPSDDLEALRATEVMVRELWDWKRNGGGAQNRSMPDAEAALKGMAEQQQESPGGDAKVSSVLLDNLPVSDEDKKKMAGVITQVIDFGVQGVVWNAVLLALGGVLLFNFFLRQ